jgi:hypothetical protein
MVKTCLCLHNMCVVDRVMEGKFVADYDPTNSVLVEGEIQQNLYFRVLQAERKAKAAAGHNPTAESEIGLSTIWSSNPALSFFTRFAAFVALTPGGRFLFSPIGPSMPVVFFKSSGTESTSQSCLGIPFRIWEHSMNPYSLPSSCFHNCLAYSSYICSFHSLRYSLINCL